MFCPNCGAQNADGVPFCGTCGSAVNSAPQQPTYTQPTPNYPQQPAPGYNPYGAAPVSVPSKGMGITGMILGIIALVFMCVWYISVPCAIVGAILSGISGSKAKRVGMKNGMATAGLVCSCIALGLAVLWIAFIGALLAEAGIVLGSL